MIQDLDELPFMATDFLEELQLKHGKNVTAYLVSSRGCYKNCSFCSIAAYFDMFEGCRIKTMESCQKIKFYRKKRNMTQDELAEAANLSTSYISQVETGRKNIGREGLEKIAEALQVLPAMLIQCDDMVRKDVKSCQIMKELEDCSDYELSVIHDILLSLKSSLRENYLG